ncbi:MAG: tetratricopeptide repeat protein [Chitinivibrionales bacterium]
MNTDKASPDQERFAEENTQAEEFITQGDLPSAARILVTVVEQDPQNWRAYNDMGIISWMQKAWEDAWSMFKMACSIKPDYADALVNFFDAGLKLRRIEQVLPFLHKALEVDPELKEIQILAQSVQTQGDDIYPSERAMKVGVHNPRIEKANALLEEGKLNEAMSEYLAINDSEGPSAETFNGLGIVSYYQQRYKDAFTLFFESIKLNPANTDTYLNLLDAARQTGNVEDAKKIYSLYSKEFPSLKVIEEDFKKV